MSSFSIELNLLSKTFRSKWEKAQGIKALDKISLSFSNSRIHGIIGPEGAGKTTLMRILAGLLFPNEGSVEFYSHSHSSSHSQPDSQVNSHSQLDEKKIWNFKEVRNLIAYMPQSQNLYPDLSIEDHLIFFKDLYSLPEKVYQERKEQLLHITKLQPFQDRLASQLSGGMYKKLGLMCSLLRSPHILLLDEPTNGVDPISRREFWALLNNLQNVLILISTSYMDEAERCEKVHLLQDGKVLASGEPKNLLQEAKVKNFDDFFIKKTEPSAISTLPQKKRFPL